MPHSSRGEKPGSVRGSTFQGPVQESFHTGLVFVFREILGYETVHMSVLFFMTISP